MHTTAEQLGARIADKYQLLSELGRGGMGAVYEAVHLWTGRRVAVKVIHAELADDPIVATRFLNEARAATRLAHPHVVEVLDMGRSDDGTVYQVLELLTGETLAQRLAREGRLSTQEAITLLAPIMDALGRAHGLGIIHRDVKPANVFLVARPGAAEKPVLLDFGVAKLLREQGVSTASSTILGSPHYMAPEQALGAPDVGPAADVWAVGTMLFECIAGELPFGRRPPTAYVARMLREPAPPLVIEGCPAHVAQACARALAREAEGRFPTMAAFAQALAGEGPVAPTARREPWWRSAARRFVRSV